MVVELLVEAFDPLIRVRVVHKLTMTKGTLNLVFLFGHSISLETVKNIRKARTLERGSTFIDGAGVFIPAHTLPCY